MYYAYANASSIVENVISIKSGVTINVGESRRIRKNNICAKRITFGILPHVLVKVANIRQALLTIQLLRVMKLCKRQKPFQQKVLQQKLFQQKLF